MGIKPHSRSVPPPLRSAEVISRRSAERRDLDGKKNSAPWGYPLQAGYAGRPPRQGGRGIIEVVVCWLKVVKPSARKPLPSHMHSSETSTLST